MGLKRYTRRHPWIALVCVFYAGVVLGFGLDRLLVSAFITG